VRGQPSPTRGVLRVLRGGALAAVSATLAVSAHAVAGGMAPDTGLTVLVTAGVAAAGIAVADRRRSTGAILAVLGAAQLATHVLLSVDEMPMPGSPHVDGWTMTAAHALAVLLSAVLLSRADAALFLVVAVLAMLLPSVWTAPPVPSAPSVARRRAPAHDRCTAVLLHRSHARRGPPVAA
jgi:hypothetical protein